MPALVTATHTLHLSRWAIPSPLWAGFVAAQKVMRYVEIGELGRSKTEVDRWITRAITETQRRNRRVLIQTTRDFLAGAPLEDAQVVLNQRYREYLLHDPHVQAERTLVREMQRQDAQAMLVASDEGDDWVWPVLLGWLR